jgi:hypothetical protein
MRPGARAWASSSHAFLRSGYPGQKLPAPSGSGCPREARAHLRAVWPSPLALQGIRGNPRFDLSVVLVRDGAKRVRGTLAPCDTLCPLDFSNAQAWDDSASSERHLAPLPHVTAYKFTGVNRGVVRAVYPLASLRRLTRYLCIASTASKSAASGISPFAVSSLAAWRRASASAS